MRHPTACPPHRRPAKFSFANMVKDVWGPGADSYVFNPANISALQFKLSAKPSETSYMLCIGQVGLIR